MGHAVKKRLRYRREIGKWRRKFKGIGVGLEGKNREWEGREKLREHWDGIIKGGVGMRRIMTER